MAIPCSSVLHRFLRPSETITTDALASGPTQDDRVTTKEEAAEKEEKQVDAKGVTQNE